MQRKTKKAGFIVLALLMVGSLLTACGTSPKQVTTGQATAKQLKMGVSVQDMSNPYFVQLINGMKEEAAKNNIVLTTVDGKSDSATQVSAVENFIAQKMDVIILAPIDPVALEPLVVKAHAAKIPVINPTQTIAGVDANINLIDLEYGMVGGRIAGQWIKDNLGGNAEVAILNFPRMQALIDRANGIKKGILEVAPNAKIVAEQPANTPATGMQAAETILQSHPNVKVIVATNDAGALGAYQAVKNLKKDSKDFCITGLDATPEALAKIKEGDIFRGTVDIQPFQTGTLTIQTALKVLKDGPIKDMVKIPMKAVTITNIGDYLK